MGIARALRVYSQKFTISMFMKIANFIILVTIITFNPVNESFAQNPGSNINPGKLEALRLEAERTNSDAVIIFQNNEPVAEWYFDKEPKKIETMSAYKSIVSLAIGRLLTQQLIDSLDQPVYTLYPEWNQGQKKLISIRHLLNHTSGLQNVANAGAEIYPAPDAIQLALTAELESEPGTRFAYNNKAVNLLSGIILKASGMKLDVYLKQEFFSRMDIEEYKFYYDQSGNPHAMAGLELHARDVAKFGLLVLNEGKWKGEQLIDPGYIQLITSPGQDLYPFSGLLWWLMPEYSYYILDEQRINDFRESGIPDHILKKLQPIIGKRFDSIRDRNTAITDLFGENWLEIQDQYFKPAGFDHIFHHEYGDIKAWYADGYLGQYMVVVPDAEIVAVRQIANFDGYNFDRDGFRNFRDLVIDLTIP
jgi:CubicO group peptidase (beta-lactamase class C family)